MCIVPSPAAPTTPRPAGGRTCPPETRQVLAVAALAGASVTELARRHDVSRKFVYQQRQRAEEALDGAFAPGAAADDVLFELPVTRGWLRQLVLGLVLVCHSSLRGVTELLADVFDCPMSVGTVFNIVAGAVSRARAVNGGQDLSAVGIGVHDELFQAGWPVLVGACARSGYCYLLSREEHRDADTWGVRLLELADRGFAPEATIADAAAGLRAGQAEALPGVPCRGDVFHAVQELLPLVRYLENRACACIATRAKLEHRQAETERRHGHKDSSLAQQLRHARPAEEQAVALAEAVALLVRWLREDVLAVAGPDAPTRRALYDWLVAELRARAPLCPHRLGPVCRLLENQRDALLAFAAALDGALESLADQFAVPAALAREALAVQALDARDGRRWRREAVRWRRLGDAYPPLRQAVEAVAAQVVRSSSVIENLNSRLRNYFFLRRQLGPDYLALLQFFLNHRRFLRSEHPERVGQSPAELLTGQPHAHWLELLGYRRFSRP
jgi:hypothetical protein